MTADFQPMFGGRRLLDWVRAGGRPDRRVTALSLRQTWQSYWFELNWRTQLSRISALPLPEDPVFILGLWRSGTTVLHELLAASTGWRTPQTWQCFNPSTCFLHGPPARPRVSDRPMDRGRIESLGPQEDEFALLLLGGASVYRGFIDPRRLGECVKSLTMPDRDGMSRWQDFVRGIASYPSKSRLLIKSPSHSFRLPFIRSSFPGAKYVWLGRQTGEVLESNLRMWKAMMSRYALWPCPAGTLEAFLEDVFRRCEEVLTQCVEEVPPERLLYVDFEALTADPKTTLECILRFLTPSGVSDPEATKKIDAAIARIPVHQGARATLPPSDVIRKLENVRCAARGRFGLAAHAE